MKLKIKNEKVSKYVLLVFNTMLLIAIFAAATFAWIPNTVRRTKTITYENQIVISSLELNVELSVYDTETNQYTLIGSYIDGESQTNDTLDFRLNPNDKMSYKFEITNTSTTSVMTCNITFEEFYAIYDDDVHDPEYGSNIFDYLSLHVVNPFQKDISQLSLGFTTTYTNTNNLVFIEGLTLEPGESEEIIWYFELSKEASNEFWGAVVGFKNIFFEI